MKPLVTVGIPAYNRPTTLSVTLNCIRNQTYTNLEILVSDDCSSDPEVSEVVKSVMRNEPRIRFFRQERNLGASNNYRFLSEQAQGKYFFWADDEDSCSPTFVEKLVSCLEQDPEMVACACDMEILDKDGKSVRIEKIGSIRPDSDWNKCRKLFFRFPTSNIFFCVYSIFKTDALRRARVQDLIGWRGYESYGEVQFLARLATLGRIAAIPETLKNYRYNPNSLYHREMAKISIFDHFMLRFTIRMGLLRIIFDARQSLSVKVSLLGAVMSSFFHGAIVTPIWTFGYLSKVAVRKIYRHVFKTK